MEVLFEPRTVCWEYWLNQDCVVGVLVEPWTVFGVLVEPRTVRWEYWLNTGL